MPSCQPNNPATGVRRSGTDRARTTEGRRAQTGRWYGPLIIVLALGLLLSGSVQVLAQNVQTTDDPIDGMWIDMGLRPQLVEDYNQIARPDDIARADHISMVDVLDDVTTGRKLVVFKSVVDAEALLPRIGDKFDIIGYNLEHGPANRPDEQADPVGSVIRMRELADEYGMELALGPDRTFAIRDGVAMAPYVDIYILQVQRVQEDPTAVREFVEPLITAFRTVNPDVQVSVQIRTEGDTMELRELVASLSDLIDGISILTSPETVAVASSLLDELRPEGAMLAQGEPGGTSADVASGAPESERSLDAAPGVADAAQEPAEAEALTVVDATPAVQPSVALPTAGLPIAQDATAQTAAAEDEFNQRWFMAGSFLTIGILGGGLLIASLVYAYQHMGQR